MQFESNSAFVATIPVRHAIIHVFIVYIMRTAEWKMLIHITFEFSLLCVFSLSHILGNQRREIKMRCKDGEDEKNARDLMEWGRKVKGEKCRTQIRK